MKNVDLFAFDSLAAYYQAANGKPIADNCVRNLIVTDDDLRSVMGGVSWEQLSKLALDGWREGGIKASEQAKALVDKISLSIEKENVVYDVEGSGIDVGLYLNGEAECWVKPETVADNGQGRRLIRILANGTSPGRTDQNVIIQRGAAMAAVVELLTYAGHSVLLDVAWVVEGNGGRTLIRLVSLKRHDQPLNMATTAFALAHPATRLLRCQFIDTLERKLATRYGGCVGSLSYGMPTDVPTEMQRAYDLYIPCLNGSNLDKWRNPQTAVKWTIETLKAQGIHIKEGKEGV